jgi:hypothetical protein
MPSYLCLLSLWHYCDVVAVENDILRSVPAKDSGTRARTPSSNNITATARAIRCRSRSLSLSLFACFRPKRLCSRVVVFFLCSHSLDTQSGSMCGTHTPRIKTCRVQDEWWCIGGRNSEAKILRSLHHVVINSSNPPSFLVEESIKLWWHMMLDSFVH